MKTFYFHVNNHNQPKKELGKLSKRQQRKVVKHSFTVAGVYDGTHLKLGVSKCSPNDPFNKKKGRTIAEGRAKSKLEYAYDIEILSQDKVDISKLFIAEAKNLIKTIQ